MNRLPKTIFKENLVMVSPTVVPTTDASEVKTETVTSTAFKAPPSSGSFIYRTLRSLSRIQLALALLAYILAIHLIGLYHFTQGFLLTRSTLENVTPAYSPNQLQNAEGPLSVKTHEKAIFLIIDALRSDFVVPWPAGQEGLEVSPNFHNVLTLPGRLTAQDPSRSIIFDTHSDPPTTTMQRIKGFTTGSLPTFIDAGANFASTAILEDSWIAQLNAANKSIGFMGDDTWMRLFPDSFAYGHPYDSFNVEDLHTVDQGVVKHLYPYLAGQNGSSWDVLIGHFLGVDHVGHRTGPHTTTMRNKLEEMNDVLERVVNEMDDDTLLIVLGDHGMDDRGDHGGDGIKETSAALWIYSKSRPIVSNTSGYKSRKVLENGPSVRKVDQIDIVPTMSLLLGLPLPFNNLGSVIPEFFQGDLLKTATETNRKQIEAYLREYTRHSSNGPLARLLENYGKAVDANSVAADYSFNGRALSELRSLWAQFSIPKMIVGITILGLSLIMIWAYYIIVRNRRSAWFPAVVESLGISLQAASIAGSVVGTLRGFYTLDPAEAIRWAVAAGAIAAEICSIVPITPALWSTVTRAVWFSPSAAALAAPMVTILHSVAFGANSFLIWEDRLTTFFLITLALLPVLKALVAPMARLRLRIFAFSIGLAVVCRIIAISTVCREEQQPFCQVTFYAGAESAIPPSLVLYGTLPLAWNFPRLLLTFLRPSKADSGPALPFMHGLRVIVTLASCYWLIENTLNGSDIRPERLPLFNGMKMWLARSIMGFTLGAGFLFWKNMPLCIEVKREDQTGATKEVEVYGFANAYGSGYLFFFTIPFIIIYLVNQLTGQLMLIFLVLALLLHLEAVDSMRDSKSMIGSFASSNPADFEGSTSAIQQPTYRDITVLSLLGHAAFFATGHQAVFTTMQWKSAFVGVATVVYPISPILVVLNSWGPTMLLAFAVPLITLWNVSPVPNGTVPLVADTLQAALGFILHYTAITVTSAVCSAWLRRHLMVWKIFAPRFMSAAVTLVLIQLAILLAIGVGLSGMRGKVKRTFNCDML